MFTELPYCVRIECDPVARDYQCLVRVGAGNCLDTELGLIGLVEKASITANLLL